MSFFTTLVGQITELPKDVWQTFMRAGCLERLVVLLSLFLGGVLMYAVISITQQ